MDGRVRIALRMQKRRRRAAKRRAITTALAVAGVLLGSLVAVAGDRYNYYAGDLPDPSKLTADNLPQSTEILDRHGRLLYLKHGPETRTVVPLSRIARVLQQATIDIEDRNFYEHHGLDFPRLAAAAYADITHRGVAQGGSTITQQLAKARYVGPERSIDRKIREAMLAGEIESRYSKQQILEAYLNEIFYGHGSYGIEAASERYFGKHALDLNLAEASLLTVIPEAPSYYDPLTPEGLAAARIRQALVLDAMAALGHITPGDAASAEVQQLNINAQPTNVDFMAPHFVNYVLRYLNARFGQNLVDNGGLRVTTSLDLDLQQKAEDIVKKDVGELHSQGVNNGAMVAIDPTTGEILTYVGSADFYNLDIDGQVDNVSNPGLYGRQPGSSFKPYVYLTALSNGFTPDSIVVDKQGKLGGTKFTNFDDHDQGAISVRQALVRSRNMPALVLFQNLGYQRVLQTFRALGVTSLLKNELGSAIGSSELHMLEHAAAYGVFATEGLYHAPAPVLRIQDRNGKVIYQHDDPGRRVASAQTTYLLDDILLGYAKEWSLKLIGPAAGKSGTTDDHTDLWYMGYTPNLVVGGWMAHTGRQPNGQPIGRYPLSNQLFGVGTASNLFRDFLPVFYNGRPIPTFQKPAGVTSTTFCHAAPLPSPVSEDQPAPSPLPQVCVSGDVRIGGTTTHPALVGDYSS